MAKVMSKVTLRYGSDNPPGAVGSDTFTVFPNVVSVQGPSNSKSESEVTDTDSTGKEFLGDLADSGELVVTAWANMKNAAQQGLRADASGRQRNFQLDFKDGAGTGLERIDHVGEVFSFEYDASRGQAVQLTMRIRLSGVGTYTDDPV